MTSAHGMAQLSARQDRSGSGAMRATYIALWDANANKISGILPNQPFVIEVGYDCTQSVRDFGAAVDISTSDGTRITTLYSGFMNGTFRANGRKSSVWCYVPGLPLRPDCYSMSVYLGTDREMFDFVERAVDLNVEDVDVYGSGRLPQKEHGPLLGDYRWHDTPVWADRRES
jgi:hypothetical protein